MFIMPLKLYCQENYFLNWLDNPPYLPDYKVDETYFCLNIESSLFKYSGYVYCQVIVDAE